MEIAIYGGTVMMLAYDCRAATKDVDAIFRPAAVVEPLVVQVAQELHLPDDWLNNGVKVFVAKREEREAFAELQIPGLVITRPSAKWTKGVRPLFVDFRGCSVLRVSRQREGSGGG